MSVLENLEQTSVRNMVSPLMIVTGMGRGQGEVSGSRGGIWVLHSASSCSAPGPTTWLAMAS